MSGRNGHAGRVILSPRPGGRLGPVQTVAFIVLLALVLLLVLMIARANRQSWSRGGIGSGMAEREQAARVQAEIEENEIGEMLAGRDALRRRMGKPSIGDALADEVRRPGEGNG